MGAKDLTGLKFGRWTVLERAGSNKHGRAMWRCICECGNEKAVDSRCLLIGSSRSCGCLNKEQQQKTGIYANAATHGQSRTRLYRIWKAMKGRCENPHKQDFHLYGGRGISVCEEWHSFEPFRDWANDAGYSDAMSIDRIDVNGNYCPENCRWATIDEQARNKRNTRFLTIDGVTKRLSQWAAEAGLTRSAMYKRISEGLSGRDLIAPSKRKGMVSREIT